MKIDVIAMKSLGAVLVPFGLCPDQGETVPGQDRAARAGPGRA
jgi:hypothetical protein